MTDVAPPVRPDCPACQTVVLTAEEERGVPHLRCPSCAGVFFTVEDLARYVEREAGDPAASTAFWRLFKAAVRDDVPSDGIRHCVRCTATLDRLGFGEYPFAILDRCGEHGLWLDSHDLPRIVRAARVNATHTSRLPRPDDQSFQKPEVGPAMVCPNCQGRFPGLAPDARCPACNVGLFRE